MKTRYILKDQRDSDTVATRDSIAELFAVMRKSDLSTDLYYIVEQHRNGATNLDWRTVARCAAEEIEANNYEIPKDCYYE